MAKLLAASRNHYENVWAADFTFDDKILLTASADGAILSWDSTSLLNSTLYLEKAHTKPIRCIEFTPDGSLLATCGCDKATNIWKNKTLMETLEVHSSEVKSLAWNEECNFLATCGRDKAVYIWEADIDSMNFDINSVLQDHEGDVKKVKFRKNMLYSCSYDNTVRVWNYDYEVWGISHVLKGHKDTVWDVDFIDNDFFSVSSDGTIKKWSTQNSAIVPVSEYTHPLKFQMHSISHYQKVLIVTAEDGVYGIDSNTMKQLWSIPLVEQPNFIKVSNSEKYAIVCCDDGVVCSIAL